MKKYVKMFLFVVAAGTFASCTDEGDTNLPPMAHPIYSEDFTREAGQFNFTTEGWKNIAQTGTETWFKAAFGGNDYIEFSSFGSGESSNIGWAITPGINIDSASQKRLIFQSAQHHATSLENKFELLVSTDFDGTNLTTANWTTLNFRLPEYTNGTNYDFVNSGPVDLSAYSGVVYIAFRVTGDGTFNSDLDGGFQVDNIKIF
jgi:hypothetical protein